MTVPAGQAETAWKVILHLCSAMASIPPTRTQLDYPLYEAEAQRKVNRTAQARVATGPMPAFPLGPKLSPQGSCIHNGHCLVIVCWTPLCQALCQNEGKRQSLYSVNSRVAGSNMGRQISTPYVECCG